MKKLITGMIIVLGLFVVSIASASTAQYEESGKQNIQVASSQSITTSTETGGVAANTKSKAIFTQMEAMSLCEQGNNLLAETDAGEIKVGAIDGNDLVYVLVVVLLVVVILAVVH